MLLCICRAHLIADVVDWGGEQVEVIEEHRCREDEVEFDRATDHGVVGVGGHDIDAFLCGFLDAFGRNKDVHVDTEVDIGTAGRVVAVGSHDVVAFVKVAFLLGRELVGLSLNPCLTGFHNLVSVDVEL